MHVLEKELIQALKVIDREKYYLRLGYRSLSDFCKLGLRFSEWQTQRIVLQVRKVPRNIQTEIFEKKKLNLKSVPFVY